MKLMKILIKKKNEKKNGERERKIVIRKNMAFLQQNAVK
jgi:hypothetical protein